MFFTLANNKITLQSDVKSKDFRGGVAWAGVQNPALTRCFILSKLISLSLFVHQKTKTRKKRDYRKGCYRKKRSSILRVLGVYWCARSPARSDPGVRRSNAKCSLPRTKVWRRQEGWLTSLCTVLFFKWGTHHLRPGVAVNPKWTTNAQQEHRADMGGGRGSTGTHPSHFLSPGSCSVCPSGAPEPTTCTGRK